MTVMKPTAVVLLALGLFSDARGEAQVGDGSGISTRSDVKMSIEGAMGTSGDRLGALAKHLGTPLGEVKRCYGEIVKEHPEVTGTLLVDLELPEKGPTKVAPVGAENLNKKMRKCIEGAFKKVTGKDVPRPAKARVVLELSNTAAERVGEVREREKEASHVEVKTDADGSKYSEGKSLQNEIHFRVSANGADAAGIVERMHTAIRDNLPSLFDCRRKSSKLGSPEGELVVDVVLNGKAEPKVEVRSNTVKSDRAEPCVDRALTQGIGDRGRGKAQLKIRFTP